MLNIKIIDKYAPMFTNYYRNMFLTGGRASTKSYTAGFYCLLAASQRRENILCCREIQKSIKDSVIAQLAYQIEMWKMPYFSVGAESITHMKTGSKFMFHGLYRNENSLKSIPEVTLAWVEEAQSISKKSIDILIPTVRGNNSRIIWTWNPFDETDAVYQEFMLNKRDDSFYMHTTFRDNQFCPDVIINEAKVLKDRSLDDYLHIYEGEFAKKGADNLITSADIYKAYERIILVDGSYSCGVDCARYGDDTSTIVVRKGMKQIKLEEYSKLSVTQLARQVMHDIEYNKTIPIKVDVGGLGAGVYDVLKENEYNAYEVNFGATPKDPDRYEDVISEAWKEFANNLPSISLIKNTRLTRELTTRKYEVTKKGKFKIESKKDYKKRGYKSPDVADGTLLCFYEPANVNYFGFV